MLRLSGRGARKSKINICLWFELTLKNLPIKIYNYESTCQQNRISSTTKRLEGTSAVPSHFDNLPNCIWLAAISLLL